MGRRIGSLFSGAGGLDLAVQEVFGGEVVWHAEIDKAASKVLAHRFPGVPNLGDISAVDWADVPAVDVLCGGFPCQDVSAAGKRAGIKAGTRSGLWSVFADAIDALRPQWVVIENVRGLLSATAHRTVDDADSDVEPAAGVMGDGAGRPVLRAAGAVLGDLADLGYDAQWATVSASSVGAPHRRERVFILASDSNNFGLCGETDDAHKGWESDVAGSVVRGEPEGCGTSASAPGNAADSSGDGRDEGRPESAGIVGGFDAAVSRDEPGVALLPTPAAGNFNDGEDAQQWLERQAAVKERLNNGNGMGMPLSVAVQLLPTPGTMDDREKRTTHAGGNLTLQGAVVGVNPVDVERHLRAGRIVAADDGVELLPTPNADVGRGVRSPDGIAKRIAKGDKQFSLEDAVALLPTPRVGGGGDCESERRRNSPGLETIAVTNLLPTPISSDCHAGKRPDGRTGGDYLNTIIEILLPTPSASDSTGGGANPETREAGGHHVKLCDEALANASRWGKYASAIARWEAIVGPAPAPTEPNKNGNPRLSAAFSEWLMGWPAGWVTDPDIGISRNDQLRIIGNGVCPQQAIAALRFLLAVATGTHTHTRAC